MTVDTVTGEVSPTPYQLLPRLTDDEYEALKSDIAEFGVRVPIDVDEFGTIIDGHHRAWICADLGVECPRRMMTDLTDEQKRIHALAVNVFRRNLTGEQRRELILRLRNDGMSTHAIAPLVGVDQSTVVRALESAPESPDANASPRIVTGRDGKFYADQKALAQRRSTVSQMHSEGLTGKDIAVALGVSPSTVNNDLKMVLTPDQGSPSGKDKGSIAARVETIRELAAKAYTAAQIAREVDRGEDYVRLTAKEHGIEIPAEKLLSRTRRADSNRIIRETVQGLEGYCLGFGLLDMNTVDQTQVPYWADSLRSSIKALNKLLKELSE